MQRQLVFADGNVGVRSRAVTLLRCVGPSRAAGAGHVLSHEEQAREVLGCCRQTVTLSFIQYPQHLLFYAKRRFASSYFIRCRQASPSTPETGLSTWKARFSQKPEKRALLERAVIWWSRMSKNLRHSGSAVGIKTQAWPQTRPRCPALPTCMSPT